MYQYSLHNLMFYLLCLSGDLTCKPARLTQDTIGLEGKPIITCYMIVHVVYVSLSV